jgi:hypothetical protein
MRVLIKVGEVLKEIMVTVFGKDFKLECITHSNAFHNADPSSDELIHQSELFEENVANMRFAQISKLSPRTKYLDVPLYWFK